MRAGIYAYQFHVSLYTRSTKEMGLTQPADINPAQGADLPDGDAIRVFQQPLLLLLLTQLKRGLLEGERADDLWDGDLCSETESRREGALFPSLSSVFFRIMDASSRPRTTSAS